MPIKDGIDTVDTLIFRYPVSKCKISKYLDISRYLLGHFSIAYSCHCTVRFNSFLCWVQSFDSDKSYSMMFSLQVQIDTSISFWLMCFCLVVSSYTELKALGQFLFDQGFFLLYDFHCMYEKLERICTALTKILALFLDYRQFAKRKICP